MSKNDLHFDIYVVFAGYETIISYSSRTRQCVVHFSFRLDKDIHLSSKELKMNSEKTSKYSLLSDGEDDGHYPQPKAHKSRRSVLLYLILCVFLVASISLNISLLTKSDSSTKESALPESRWGTLLFIVEDIIKTDRFQLILPVISPRKFMQARNMDQHIAHRRS